MTRKLILAACLVAGCAQVQTAATRIEPTLETACRDAMAVAGVASLVPGAGAIVPYITAGCATAQGLTKLASDPSSVQWLGQLIGQVKVLAGLKL